MAEVRQPEEPFTAGAEAGDADYFAFDIAIVEERRFHVCARRNSIRKHPKSQ